MKPISTVKWYQLIVLSLLLIPILGHADPLDRWQQRLSGTGIDLSGVTYGNNTFVVVGKSGTILTSSDGNTWQPRISGTAVDLYAVTYGANKFVAVGASGVVLTSGDGITWVPRTSGTTVNLIDVAYGNNTFVTAGTALNTWYSIVFLSSSDGTTWSPTTIPYAGFSCVAFGNGIFVAMNTDGSSYASPNGSSWVEAIAGSTSDTKNGIGYGNGTFVTVGVSGYMHTSVDGLRWNGAGSGITNDLYGIAYGNRTFVATGNGNLLATSPDGTSWTKRGLNSIAFLRRAAFGKDTFVTVGLAGTIFQSDPFLPYSISGTVLDASGNRGVSNATVVVQDASNQMVQSIMTDSSGNFRVDLSVAGDYTVSVSKTNYQTVSMPQIVGVSDTNQTATITTYLSQAVGSTFLSLSQGWNFVSFRKQPPNTAIEAVLLDISPNLRAVWGYNAQTQAWLKYTPPGQNSSLSVMESGKGYWIYMSSASIIDTTSWSPPISNIPLYDDWNLIGFGGMNNTSLATALSNIPGDWDIVWGWENGVWRATHAVLSALPVPTLTSFSKDKAYWIKIRRGQATYWAQ